MTDHYQERKAQLSKRGQLPRWADDPVYESFVTMRPDGATQRGKELVRSLVEDASVGAVVPPGADGNELAVLTERSSDHVLVAKENDRVGWLCRSLDSEGVDALNRWGLYVLRAVDSSPADALQRDDLCGHCENRLHDRFGGDEP